MLDSEYTALLDGDDTPPSWIMAPLPVHHDCPGVTEILALLRDSDLELTDLRPAHRRLIPEARWELELTLGGEDEDLDPSREMRLWVVPSQDLGEHHYDWAHSTEHDRREVEQSRWSLGLFCEFGPEPLRDFHDQLRILATAAPDALVFIDMTGCRAHGAAWVREAAATAVPPPPHSLFAIHAVYPEAGDRGGSWLHTHGLVRCGIPELEMVDIPEQAVSSCGLLLNTVAAMCIENGMPEPASPFAPGADMDLIWLPWQKALPRLKRGRLGAMKDRNEYHAGPSAVLFAPQRKLMIRRLVSPAVYLPKLEDNPLLYVSNMETNRMSALAKERLDRFHEVFERRAGEEDWVFLVKLGYRVDDAEEEGDREHLWFEVHHLHGRRCEATLLNEPYRVSSMHEGERAEHDLELLTDWQIISPLGRFSADTIVHLPKDDCHRPPVD